MNRLAIIGAGLTAAAITAALGGWAGHHYTATHMEAVHKADLARISQANSTAITKAVTEARADERKSVQDVAAIDTTKFKELQNEIISSTATIAGLRADSVRLRSRFTCPAAPAADRAPEAGTTTSLGDAGTPAGLQAADGEFLIGIGTEANQVAIQLAACQAIVRKDRGE